ncbi:hypothetical protein WJX72_011209 [[Myrmecia] bisecta]|uniref:Uncharacterized protein n=1 Tax=[Myrmecia] bisecta TaxID=41462 RepID=A0AAW1QGH1_9CHLO
MPPKKASGKKGKSELELQEPDHDASWERAVDSGIWDRPPPALPDANTWPTWGALRERILTACKEIRITWSPSLRDAFPVEIIKLSPQELTTMVFRGSANLTKLVLSPLTSCPKLTTLDLAHCPKLTYVLLQSASLQTLMLSNCPSLTKALIHCNKLDKLEILGCPNLDTLMIWSEFLTELDLSDSKDMTKLQLQCPQLIVRKLPLLQTPLPPAKPVHLPIATMLKERYKDLEQQQQEKQDVLRRLAVSSSVVPKTHKPF